MPRRLINVRQHRRKLDSGRTTNVSRHRRGVEASSMMSAGSDTPNFDAMKKAKSNKITGWSEVKLKDNIEDYISGKQKIIKRWKGDTTDTTVEVFKQLTSNRAVPSKTPAGKYGVKTSSFVGGGDEFSVNTKQQALSIAKRYKKQHPFGIVRESRKEQNLIADIL